MKQNYQRRVRPALHTRRHVLHALLFAGLALVSGAGFTLGAPSGVQEDAALFGAIEKALASGDAERVLSFAGSQIEIRILGRGSLYSNAQALYVLEEFLDTNPPKRVAFTEYASSDDRRFAFGSYWTQGRETPYQVYVNLRERDGRWELRELRVEAS